MEVVIQLLGFEDQGCDQPLIESVGHAGGQHADNGVCGSIDPDLLANDIGI